MPTADPRLALPEDQRRGAAGLSGRKLTDAERRRRLAAARAERERRRRAKAAAEAARRARELAEKRAARSREVVADSPPPRPFELGHKRDAIENLRSYGSARGRLRYRIEDIRARTTPDRELRSPEEATRTGAERAIEAKLERSGIALGGLGSLSRGVSRHLKKAARDILYGTSDLAADYATALYGDLTETDVRSIPFRRTGRQLAKDVLGFVGFAETAIPEPKFLPEWMRREVLEVDPENVSIRRGSGEVDPDDARKAAQFWRENPILGALGVLPAASAVARAGSRGALAASIRAANPTLSTREARRIAKRESRMPGYAAAHGYAGGIEPRVLTGGLRDLTRKAREATPKLERILAVVTKDTGARAVPAPPKGTARARRKLRLEYLDDPAQLRDLARGTIIVRDGAQLDAVLARLKRTGAVVGARNEFSGVRSLGYQHGKVWLDLDGHVVEVQITTPPMYRAKERGGHKLYERWRALPDGPEKDRLAAQSRDWYMRMASSSSASRSSSVSASQGAMSGTRLDRSLPTSAGAELPASSVGSSPNLERIFASAFTDSSVRQAGVVVGRPWSRHPLGRAGQRAYDRASRALEERFGPGVRFGTTQRAARAKERELRKARARHEAEVVRLERVMRKGIGKLGRSRSGQEALIAVLEAPRALTPRQAVEVKLFDLRQTIERPRTPDEARARVNALDKEISKRLRPVVDKVAPPAVRRREQAMRNVLSATRGKRARAGLRRELELTSFTGSAKSGGSVLADAQAEVERVVVQAAAKPDADPQVRELARKIIERDMLRERVNEPEFVFGDAAADLGVEGAPAAAAKRLRAQVAALERALADGTVDRPEFARAVEAAETLSRQADEYARRVLGMSDEELAARRNVVAARYAERGLLPEGVAPEARGFFPHRHAFERVGAGHGGMVGIPASGGVIGRPTPGRAFERRQNRLALYESGEVATSPRVLSNTVRQRARYAATLEARTWLYERGKPIRRGEPVPQGAMLVRNPAASPEKIPPAVRAAIEQPERFAELAGRAGDMPDPTTFQAWLDTWLYRGHGPEPEWLADTKNVRAVPETLVRTLLSDVFASAPRGSIASIFGALNALARATTIYLPYGGARYVARNTPQNMILLALTQPRAFLQVRKSVATLRRKEPDVYAAIKAEAGTIPAAAGLPELAGMRRSRAQRLERGMTDASRRIAGGLGELTDEPWRVASWLQYAKAYGFDSPPARRRLLTSDEPAIKRVRDDIAQRVRDDMIDFDALPPWARENLSRYLFILPFVAGAGKWPLVYLREYPARAAILALLAAQHAREETPGRETSVLESGRTEIGGREVDIGWLSPIVPAAGTAEDLMQAIEGTDRDRIEWRPIAGMLAPQYRAVVDALGYGEPTEQVARAFLPGYSTAERLREGGSLGDQALRFLGSDIRHVEPRRLSPRERVVEDIRTERKAVLAGLKAGGYLRDNPTLARRLRDAYAKRQQLELVRAEVERELEPGEERDREKLRREVALLRSWGLVSASKAREIARVAESGSHADVKSWRSILVSEGFEQVYLGLLREAREAAGLSA